MASRRQEVIVEMKLDKTSLAAVQSEIKQAFAAAELAQQLRQTNGRYFLGGQRVSGARAELITNTGAEAEKGLPGLLETEQHIKSTIDAKIRQAEQQQARYITSLKRLANELQGVKDKIAKDAAEKDKMHRQEVRGFPSSNIYEHRKLEQTKQDSKQLATILAGTNNMTAEMLARAENIWKHHSATIKRENLELFDTIQSGINRQKAQLLQRASVTQQALEIEKKASLEGLRVRQARLAAEKEFDMLAKKVDTDLLNARKLVTSELAKDEAKRRHLYGGTGTSRRAGLEIGGGATGRGLISGVAGLGGVNLYGLGVLGAGAAGTRAALNAYAEVFNTKNVLAGIVQTFSQFRDQQGKPLDRAANFEQSQKYSEYLYGRVRKAAVDSPLTLRELTDVYTTGVPFLARSGVSFEKSIGITNTVASLGKMMGLRLDSIKDDIRAIYEGRFRNVQTFQAAGFTSDDFKKLSNMRGDDLVKFFDQKFAGYQDALKKFAGSFTAQWDRLKDSLYQSAALIGEKVAPVFIKFATDMQNTLGQWTADGTLTRFTEDFSSILKAVGEGSVTLVTVLTTVAGAFSRAAQSIADVASGLLGSVNGNDYKSWIQGGLDVLTGNTGAWATQQRQMVNSFTGANLSGLDRQGAIIGGLETLQKEAMSGNPLKVSGYGAQDTLKLRKNEDTMRLRDFVSSNRTAKSEFINQLDSLETIEKTLRYARIVAKAETDWEKNPNDNGAKTSYYSALNKYRPIIEGNLKKVAPHLDANSLILGAKVEGPMNSYLKAVLPLGAQGLIPSGAMNQLLAVQAKIKAESIETRKQFAPDVQKMQGVNLALGYLQQQGYDVSKLTPEMLSNPKFTKLIEDLKKNAAPGLVNTAAVKPDKTKSTGAGFGSISSKQIEPDITRELSQISAIEAQQFDLEKRAARGENVSSRLRGLELQKINIEKQIALKQANKSTVLFSKFGTVKTDGLLPHVAAVRDLIKQKFNIQDIGGYSNRNIHGTKVKSDHAFGAALDPMVGDNAAGHATGDEYVKWAMENAQALNIKYIIWKQRTWKPGMKGFGPLMKSRGNRTEDHWDHPHTSFNVAPGDKLGLTLSNRDTDAANRSSEIAGKYAEQIRELERQRIKEEYDKEQEVKKRKREVNLLNLQYTHRKDLSGTDATLQYAAKLKILNAQYPGLERLKPEYRNAKAELDDERDTAIKAAQEEYALDNATTAAKIKAQQRSQFLTSFKNREGLIGLFGSDLAKARLDQDISAKEDMMSKGGIGGAWAATILPALYEQRRALERNTDALNKQLSTKFNNAVKGIFDAPEFLSPSQTYRASFNKKIEAIDNMSSSDLNAYRASMGMAGMGYTDNQLRGMLKLQATKGFSSQGFRNMQRRDQLFGGANAFLGALQSGGDPIAAFAGAYQNIDGQDAQQRLIQGLFNRGSYQKMGKMSRKMHFDKGAFNKDLIAGGGSLVANMLVGTMGGQAQTGSQIGGMLAPLLFTGLGAWAGPLGILGGGLIGSLFGKKKQVDPSIEQHRKRLEELLQSINNRLKPQEDFYRTIKGSVLWGSASRSFGGRASSLGARVALGVI